MWDSGEKNNLETVLMNFTYTAGWLAHYAPAIADVPEFIHRSALKRQVEYIAGRWCAQEALKKLSIFETVTTGPQRIPVWPAGFTGSISHSSGLAVATVGSSLLYTGIGVDVEACLECTLALKLLHKFATPAEWQLLESTLPATIGEAELVTLIFSAKESIYKAVYPLTTIPLTFKDALITAIDWEEGIFSARLLNPALQTHWPLLEGRFRFLANRVFTQCLWPKNLF